MLNGNELGNKLDGSMKEADNAAEAHNNFARALKDYVKEKLRLSGTYIGLTPNGSNDPFNGQYNWKASRVEVSGANIMNGARGGLGSWANSIKIELSNTVVSGKDEMNVITASPTTVKVISLNINMGDKPEKRIDAMKNVGRDIVSALKSAIPSPGSSAGTSSAGAGTITWGNVQ